MEIPKLEITLLGAFSLKLGGTEIMAKEFHRSKVKTMLVYLALEMPGSIHRENLIDRMWEDLDHEHAIDNYYTTGSLLRKAIGQKKGGPTYILTKRDCVSLRPENVTCDVHRFYQVFHRILREEGSIEERKLDFYLFESLYRGEIQYCPIVDPYIAGENRRLRFFYASGMQKGYDFFKSIDDKAAAAFFYYRYTEYDEGISDLERDTLSLRTLLKDMQQPLMLSM